MVGFCRSPCSKSRLDSWRSNYDDFHRFFRKLAGRGVWSWGGSRWRIRRAFRHRIVLYQSDSNRQQPLSVAIILLLVTRNVVFMTTEVDTCEMKGSQLSKLPVSDRSLWLLALCLSQWITCYFYLHLKTFGIRFLKNWLICMNIWRIQIIQLFQSLPCFSFFCFIEMITNSSWQG